MSENSPINLDLPLDERFSFGKNWATFIESHFEESRVQNSMKVFQDFTSLSSLKGKSFIDIGCGSGLHSLSAFKLGVKEIVSFDFDPSSVSTCNSLKMSIGNPPNWKVFEGSILDMDFIHKLGKFDFVYSWGVLHHTGNVWEAIKNTSQLVAPQGHMYLALYSRNVQPRADYWLAVKQKYIASPAFIKIVMEQSYLYRYYFGGSLIKYLTGFIKKEKFRTRGMELMTDVRDWLGGWPMEFVYDEDVDSYVTKLGYKQVKVKKGEACTEFLFKKIT